MGEKYLAPSEYNAMRLNTLMKRAADKEDAGSKLNAKKYKGEGKMLDMSSGLQSKFNV